MPRFARKRFVGRPKRRTKWCGQTSNTTIKNTTNVVVADAIPLCQPTSAVVDQADPTVGWCRGSISVSRLVFTDITPSIAWAIVINRTDAAGTVPLQVFNPFDIDDLERQDILGMGHIPAPPILLQADNTAAGDFRSNVVDINVRVGRRLLRNTNNIFLWIVSDSLNVHFQQQTTVRTLMKF